MLVDTTWRNARSCAPARQLTVGVGPAQPPPEPKPPLGPEPQPPGGPKPAPAPVS